MMYYPYYDVESILNSGISAISNYSLLGFVVAIFTIVCNYLVFEKAGERGWKSLIPFYNHYLEYKLYWTPAIFWVNFFLPIISIILAIVSITNYYNYGDLALTVALTVINVIILIAVIVIAIVLQVKKGKCFGEGGLFGLGLILFNRIFNAILALDKKCQYCRTCESSKQEAEKQEETQTTTDTQDTQDTQA